MALAGGERLGKELGDFSGRAVQMFPKSRTTRALDLRLTLGGSWILSLSPKVENSRAARGGLLSRGAEKTRPQRPPYDRPRQRGRGGEVGGVEEAFWRRWW